MKRIPNCLEVEWFFFKGVRKGGVGVKPPLELDILQKFYYLRKEINCFRILFAC